MNRCFVCVVGLPALLMAGLAHAATFTVTNTDDAGPGSLRQAMINALATPADDEIVFAAGANGVITLASTLPALNAAGGDLVITGNGAANTIIDGANAHRPIQAQQTGLTLRALTLRNGRAGNLEGGAIYSVGGSLTIDRVELIGNHATWEGGAIRPNDVALTITSSLFQGNGAAAAYGAAISAYGGSLVMSNTTLTAQAETTDGGTGAVIYIADVPAARLVNISLADNDNAVGVLARQDSHVSLSSSLAVDSAFWDLRAIDGASFDLAHSRNNLVHRADDSGIVDGVNGNQVGLIAPLLGALGDHGGPTHTLPLLPGSPALDAGTTAGGDIPATDQRGIARVGAPDVGAFESQGFTLTTVGGSGQSTVVGTTFAEPLVVQLGANDPVEPVAGGEVVFTAPAAGASAGFGLNPAAIGSDGRAQVTATANAVAGGPYTVSAHTENGSGSAPGVDFTLSNLGDPCAGFTFPYTLAGSDNAARVAELRQAIRCANDNAGDDVIDLGGFTLVFDVPDAGNAENALPEITSGITLRNGTLERDALAVDDFRLLANTGNGHLIGESMNFRNGRSWQGGAIYNSGTLELTDAGFVDNGDIALTQYGGAIYSSGWTMRIVGSHFEGNAARLGGAVFHDYGDLWLRGSRLENNHADEGGGLFSLSHSIRLSGNDFVGNSAQRGGAVVCIGAHIAGTRFEANIATVLGGAIVTESAVSNLYLANSLFVGNQAPQGAVLVQREASAWLHNVTISGHDGGAGSSLLAFDPGAAVSLVNSIVWGNGATPIGPAGMDIAHSVIEGGFAGGSGILDVDPDFVDPQTGDYRLADGSPAIDAGHNDDVFQDNWMDVDDDGDFANVLDDLDGHPRRYDDAGVADTGVGTAPIVDLGAHERQTDSFNACAAFVFPYTLIGSDNAARVAELREAIECGNAASSGTADIDLDGHTLVFSDGPYSDADGANALPILVRTLTLRNGTLERDLAAPPFRFVKAAQGAALHLGDLHVRNGYSNGDGGAALTEWVFHAGRTVFENNRADGNGGALRLRDTGSNANLIGVDFHGNAAAHGAAFSHDSMALLMHSRIEGNGDETSGSLIHGTTGIGLISVLIADNTLPATGSTLFHYENPVTNRPELRHVTVANNQVDAALFHVVGHNAIAYNSIVWGNVHGSLGAFNASHAIVQGATHNPPEIISRAPGFIDAGDGDYRLDAGSPAIDASTPGYLFLDAFDLDQDGDTSELMPDLDLEDRPYDDTGVADTGSGDAATLDLGPFERQIDSAAAGIGVDASGVLTTTEAGGTASFTLRLDRYPQDDVVFTLTSSDPGEGVVAPASLVFTRENWNQPRDITVMGLPDGVVDGDQPYRIVFGVASSADPAYDGLTTPDVEVINLDIDGPAPPNTVGGTVIGLLGSGLVLSLNDDENLPVTGDGGFVFTTPLATGDAYAVTVATQPSSPGQHCVVINGEGSMGAAGIDQVVINCGVNTTYAIGGEASGVTGSGLTLQLNGGGTVALAGDGSYAFAERLADGASYVVTIAQQPSGQWCTLAHAGGTVAGADVDDIDVSCAPLQVQLQLTVDDGHAYTRYGQVRDYLVTLSNSGNATAVGVTVAAQFSTAFDVTHVHWLCLPGGGQCSAAGSGGFADSADVAPGGSVTWIVSAPVLFGSNEAQAVFSVGHDALQTGLRGGDVSDSNTLVILRDGFNVPYGDGASTIGAPQPLAAEDSVLIAWHDPAADGLHDLGVFAVNGVTAHLQRLSRAGLHWVRLLSVDGDGRERVSAFAPVQPGTVLALGHVFTDDTATVGQLLLEGAAHPVSLPIGSSDHEETGR